MSANIEFNELTGKYSFVENGKKERAWHGLGQVYDRPLTVTEAIEGCNANFNVGLQPIVGLSPQVLDLINEGLPIPPQLINDLIIDGKKATMRFDNNHTLGVVSDSYGVVQNKDAFDFINVFCTGDDTEHPIIESAGMLGNGERIFITAKFPEPVLMAGDKNDPIDMYVVFTNSFDGTGAVTAMVTPVRVVCNNTLNMAFSNNSGKLSLRHTKYVKGRLDLTNSENARLAYDSMNLYSTYKTVFEEKLKALAQMRIDDKFVDRLLGKALMNDKNYKEFEKAGFKFDDVSTRMKNTFDEVKNVIHTGIGQENIEKGTGLWYVNGLTTYFQNEVKYKSDDKKFSDILDGSVQNKVQKLYDELALVA